MVRKAVSQNGGQKSAKGFVLYLHRFITICLNVGKFSTKRFKTSDNEAVTSCTYEDYMVTHRHTQKKTIITLKTSPTHSLFEKKCLLLILSCMYKYMYIYTYWYICRIALNTQEITLNAICPVFPVMVLCKIPFRQTYNGFCTERNKQKKFTTTRFTWHSLQFFS